MTIAIRQGRRSSFAGSENLEHLELRRLLSGSNAIDRLNFGNLASEAAHHFNPGVALNLLPSRGVGAVGASTGLTFRNPSGSPDLTFTVAVDPNGQNYLTARVWGNDVPSDAMDLAGADTLEESGGNVQFANRFVYFTIAIPIAMTGGKSSVQLTLDAGRPVYSVYTHTAPMFVPDSADPAGARPAVTGQATLNTLTAAEAIGTAGSPGILLANRKLLYDSGKYFDQILARQAIVLGANGTWTAPSGAPQEVAGLDLFTDLAGWMSANPSATPDVWRNRIANQKAGPGYTAFPDELLGVLSATYQLAPLTDLNNNVVYAAPRYHDASLITRIVAAIDGVTYEQDSDNGLIQQGSEWTGLTSTARTTGSYIGSKARQPTSHGGGDLQGVDTYALGWTLITLLNDPTAAPILVNYLGQSFDADLNGGSMLRATAWERLLKGMVSWYQNATGGTESQNLFQELAMYASHVALGKLQALFPNASYVSSESTALGYVKELMGLIPDTHMRGVDPGPGLTNYGLTSKGFGEAHGRLSTGFDGGGYGGIIPWLTPRVAQIAVWDVNADAATVNAIKAMASTSIDSFDQFLSPLDKTTIDPTTGLVTTNTFSFAGEPVITYRDTKNVNTYAGVFNFNEQFPASDPTGVLNNAYARRAAYLMTQYALPTRTASGGDLRSLNYLRDLSSYESTVRSLINVDPTTLTPLPGEPGQPDFAWADVQAGAVAFMNNGERMYMNLDWRNYEYNNNSFTNLVPSQYARYHYTTDTIERAGQIIMPKNSANVQPDGNLTGTAILTAKVARYGDYLVVLNDGSTTYTAKLPAGTGQAKDLVTGSLYALGASVNVAGGDYAIFWLAASKTVSPLSSSADIGAVGNAGSSSYANGIYTLSGAGLDIGGSADAFRLTSTNTAGDATLVAQVLSQTGSATAEAGIMIRADQTAGSAFAAVLRSPGNGLRFEYRSAAGTASEWFAVPSPLSAVWLKLTRSDNNISAYYSTDNASWTQIGTAQSIALPSPAMFGLAVSSHDTTNVSVATFANVSIATGIAPTVATPAAATSTIVTGTIANFSVLGADDAGEAALKYEWYVLGNAAGPVTFSANKTNAAKNVTATFSTAGVYDFRVLITDAAGATTSSDVSVTVIATASGVTMASSLPTTPLLPGGTWPFYAIATDQFGQPLQNPPAVSWSIDAGGVGSIDQTGQYTAPSVAGSAIIRAISAGFSTTGTLTVQAPSIGLFTGTQAIGITAPAQIGSASFSSGTYNITAGGSDIWGSTDQFRFVYIPMTGDGVITARVHTIQNTATFAKAGVMFRATLNADSAYALNYVSPASGTRFEYRNSAGGSAASAGTGLATTPAPNSDIYVRLTRSGNTLSAAYSSDGVNWATQATTQSGIAGMSPGSTVYVGLVVCSHTTSATNSAVFDNVTITQNVSPALPYTTAVGSSAGSASSSGNLTTLTSTGNDIWGTADAFQFAYIPITGNATITARLASVTPTTNTAKVGVMIRSSLAAGAMHMSALQNPNGNIRYAWRSSTNQNTAEATTSGFSVPYWLRVTRSGNTLTASRSPDGQAWTNIGSQTIVMGSTVYVGLVAAGLGSTTTPSFDNITITGTVNTGPAISSVAANPNPVTAKTASLSVAAADIDGGEPNLNYTWDTVNLPPADVSFSANGTNAAKNIVATFAKSGTYTLRVTATDTGGFSVNSLVTVVVNQTLNSVAVTPATSSLSPGAAQQFGAVALDQFGLPMATQPASFSWSLSSGLGSVSASGLYSAPLVGASATIQASSGGKSGAASVSLINQAPLIAKSSGATAIAATIAGATTALTVPAVDDTGNANLIYNWTTVGSQPGAVTFGTNGTNAASTTTGSFSETGIYQFRVTITDAAGLTATSDVTFVHLIGDADRDGVVGTADFTALAANFNQVGRTWGQGDFNGDGLVNAIDFNILASGFGNHLPAAPLSESVAAPMALAIGSPTLFSDSNIEDDKELDSPLV